MPHWVYKPIIQHVYLPKTNIMKIFGILDKLERELSRGAAKTMSFEQICRKMGVNPAIAEDCVMQATGATGEQLVQCYRLAVPLALLLTPGFSSQPR